MSTPGSYLANSKAPASVYAPVPVYMDERTGLEVAIDWRDEGALLSGCQCRTRKNRCDADDDCVCVVDDPVGVDHLCASAKCKSCKKDRTRCKLHPLCECRKNALDTRVAVCNALCHGRQGPGCYLKVRGMDVRVHCHSNPDSIRHSTKSLLGKIISRLYLTAPWAMVRSYFMVCTRSCLTHPRCLCVARHS